MREEIERAILQTLIYSDIFDYPLLKDEIWKFLIGEKTNRNTFESELQVLIRSEARPLGSDRNFYYLLGREEVVKKRTERKKESRKKIVIAKKIIKRLSFFPAIQFIGISGALSLENSERNDDIDLFVIASKGSLWLTRLTMIILLMLMGRYRRRNQSGVSDKICLNMLIDESVLVFHKSRQNLYTAHEIVQLMPIFDRNNMYKKFINANKWVGKFLPNALERGTTQNRTSRQTRLARLTVPPNHADSFLSVFQRSVLRISALEHFAKDIQLWFIKKHLTTETVSDNFLAFHPLDYKKKVLSEYKKRVKLYEI